MPRGNSNFLSSLSSRLPSRKSAQIITKDGITRHLDASGELHRTDGPALIYPNSSRIEYYQCGKLHRTNGPAIIDKENQVAIWYKDGLLHREEGPAVVFADGRREYWQEGIRVQGL